MTDEKPIEAESDVANIAGYMIALCFLQAAESSDFKSEAVDRLQALAERFHPHHDRIALHAVAGALERLGLT